MLALPLFYETQEELVKKLPSVFCQLETSSQVTNPAASAGDIRDLGLILGLGRPLEEGMASHSSSLAWRIHGQRSQAGYSPQGRTESGRTDAA